MSDPPNAAQRVINRSWDDPVLRAAFEDMRTRLPFLAPFMDSLRMPAGTPEASAERQSATLVPEQEANPPPPQSQDPAPSADHDTQHASANPASSREETPRPRAANRRRKKKGNAHRQSLQAPSPEGTSIHPPPHPKVAALRDPAAMSLAESKLRRQNERIQAAEEALHAPPTAVNQSHNEREHERPTSRKSKNWQKFDFAAPSTSSSSHAVDGGVPVSETRINRYHPAPSRTTSLSRSMSSLSHHTADQDHDADDGFIVHTGRRRSRKESSQFGVYEEKPEPKQATVEAKFDERKILKVFKVPLPGPGYIDQLDDCPDGAVQFVQHPNGDVSAHQWSHQRMQWENIGQFSNIRKRIEGQLASDRLRGQTANQTLLMNTLEFFRTIAKQREATIMGLPWGAKEIEALLPEAGPALQASKHEEFKNHVEPHVPKIDRSTTSSVPSSVKSLPSLPQIPQKTTQQPPQPSQQTPSLSLKPVASNPGTGLRRPILVAVPQKSVPAPVQTTATTTRFDGGADPFYSAEHYKTIYGSQPTKQPEAPLTPSKPLLYNSFGALAANKNGLDGTRTPSASYTPSAATLQPIRQHQFQPVAKEDNSFKESFERMTSQAIKRNGPSDLRAFASSEEFVPKTFVPPPTSSVRDNGFTQSTPHAKPKFSMFTSQTPPSHSSRISHPSPFQDHTQASNASPFQDRTQATKPPVKMEASESYPGVNEFQRQQQLYDDLKAKDVVDRPEKYDEQGNKIGGYDMSRMFLPVLENIASYTGPNAKRDYFSQWCKPPEYAIDHSPNGNNSFYDPNWGTPPARIGRDPRYQGVDPATTTNDDRQAPARNPVDRLRFGEFGSGQGGSSSPNSGLDRRFQY